MSRRTPISAVLLCAALAVCGATNAFAQWTRLGDGFDDEVFAVTTFNGELYAGGAFLNSDGVRTLHIAKLTNRGWVQVGQGLNGTVRALTVWGSPTGTPRLIAGGDFTASGLTLCPHIAQWDGTAWTSVGGGADAAVYALAVYNQRLIAGGAFLAAGGVRANHIARWDGLSWGALDGGTNCDVYALTVWTDPFGPSTAPELIAGGCFTQAGLFRANYIASWNGLGWTPLSSGMGGGVIPEPLPYVYALAVYGRDLFAGGDFSYAGGNLASRVARWDGLDWYDVGGGMSETGDLFFGVRALYTPGNRFLYAGGDFTGAGRAVVNNVAVWDGLAWGDVGGGVWGGEPVDCFTSWVSPGGTRQLLIIGGAFTWVDGMMIVNHIVGW